MGGVGWGVGGGGGWLWKGLNGWSKQGSGVRHAPPWRLSERVQAASSCALLTHTLVRCLRAGWACSEAAPGARAAAGRAAAAVELTPAAGGASEQLAPRMAALRAPPPRGPGSTVAAQGGLVLRAQMAADACTNERQPPWMRGGAAAARLFVSPRTWRTLLAELPEGAAACCRPRTYLGADLGARAAGVQQRRRLRPGGARRALAPPARAAAA